MFNNIIYFIVVLLIFHISYPEKETEKSLFLNLGLIFACWAVFSVCCALGFRRLVSRFQRGAQAPSGIYHKLVFRLSVFAVIIFSLDVFVFQLKDLILQVPGAVNFEVVQGLIAIAVFMFYLSTIWYFAHPAYKLIFQSYIKRSSFIVSNQKLNFPVLFPWVILTLFIDLIALSPWKGVNEFLNHPAGMVVFFSCFLIALMIFLPVLIQYWWGCRPLKDTEKTRDIRMFLDNIGFEYRGLVNWPVFEGRMMTAGIMGIVSRFRYILVTESLMNNLSTTELKAVMAHEAGHAKYRHQLLYVFLFLGFFIIMMGVFDPQFYFVVINYILAEYSVTGISGNMFYTLSAVPVLIILVVYFRFVIGFFMRHFERQADIFSAVSMGDAAPTISALEKIGILSGKIRDLPSWHHFSIRERVEFLQKSFENPALIRRHNSLLLKSFLIYIIFVAGVIYLSYFTRIRDRITFGIIENTLSEQLLERPDDPDLLNDKKAIEAIKEAINLADKDDRYLRKQLEKFSGSMEEGH